MRREELIGKRILVVGGGVTGGSVVRYLARLELVFDLVDDGGVPAALSELVSGQVHAQLDVALAVAFDVIVLSPGVPRAHPAIVAALAADVVVIGDIELFASAVTGPVLAVTGSNGKSTVVAWLADALGRLGIRAVACGNIGEPALDSLDEKVDCHVLELSSYQLESTVSLRPVAASVLNISDDHLDRYASLEAYAEVKRRVYDNAMVRVVNADDAASTPDVADSRINRFTLAVDTGQGDASPGNASPSSTSSDDASVGEAQASVWSRRLREGRFWLYHDETPLLPASDLALPGEHNVANALAVLALLDCVAGIEASTEQLRDAICAFKGLPHRTQLVAEAGGVRWYNDSKGTNVDACAKAVAAMPGPVLLIAGGIAKGANFAPLAPVVAEHARLVVLIGRDSHVIAAALDGVVELQMAETLEAAVSICRQSARPGDAVLLSPACSSFDMFRNFEDRGHRYIEAVDEVLAA